MKKEDFKVVANFYSTNSLVYILLNSKVIGFVETYKDMYFKEVEKNKWESQKKKRTPSEITNEVDSLVRNYIKNL
jgi:hypothetical protein